MAVWVTMTPPRAAGQLSESPWRDPAPSRRRLTGDLEMEVGDGKQQPSWGIRGSGKHGASVTLLFWTAKGEVPPPCSVPEEVAAPRTPLDSDAQLGRFAPMETWAVSGDLFDR